MKPISSILLVLAMMFIGPVMAQKQVYKLPIDAGVKLSGNEFGFMMPTTAIKLDVTVTKVREIKGYYADDAEKMLGLTNVIANNRTYYKLCNVEISTEIVPDNTQAYLVEPSSNMLKNNSLAKSLLQKSATTAKKSYTYSTKTSNIPDFFKNYANASYTETEDDFVETKIINGVVTQVPANRTKLVSKSAGQKVQEAADRITQIRKDRNSLIAGEQEVAYSKEALELMINELNQAENDYLDLFRGIVLEDETHYIFYVIPESDNLSFDIFSLDQHEGFAAPASENGVRYQLRFSPVVNMPQYTVSSDVKPSPKGFPIRQEQQFEVYLQLNHENVHNFGTFSMLQWSPVKFLPCNLDPDINNIGFIF